MSSEILESVGLKTCLHCEQTLPVSEFGKYSRSIDGLNSKCKNCYNSSKLEYARQWRDDNREYLNERARQYYENPEARRKNNVVSIVNNAIARGELIRPDACPQCGDDKPVIQAHHWSYEVGDELDVIWLCPRCHMALHKRNKID